MKCALKYAFCLLTSLVLLVGSAMAGDGPYLLELGAQAGVGYYVGDASKHIFMQPREVYGAQFRYKIDRRWAVQVKGQASRIAFDHAYTNNLISLDAVAEFNFFRFGNDWTSGRTRPYTPYIFLGVGLSLYDGYQPYSNLGAYLPFGIGFKWKFAKHCGLQLAWQHNMYFVDDLENRDEYNNVEKLNGSNILNCDLTGNLTFGLVFDFIEARKVCRTCDWQ